MYPVKIEVAERVQEHHLIEAAGTEKWAADTWQTGQGPQPVAESLTELNQKTRNSPTCQAQLATGISGPHLTTATPSRIGHQLGLPRGLSTGPLEPRDPHNPIPMASAIPQPWTFSPPRPRKLRLSCWRTRWGSMEGSTLNCVGAGRGTGWGKLDYNSVGVAS